MCVCVCVFVCYQNPLHAYEEYSPALQTLVAPGDVVPFWTMTDADKMVVVTGTGKEATSKSFLFKKPDNIILQFDNNNNVRTRIYT